MNILPVVLKDEAPQMKKKSYIKQDVHNEFLDIHVHKIHVVLFNVISC